jgi:hypothetical protein
MLSLKLEVCFIPIALLGFAGTFHVLSVPVWPQLAVPMPALTVLGFHVRHLAPCAILDSTAKQRWHLQARETIPKVHLSSGKLASCVSV